MDGAKASDGWGVNSKQVTPAGRINCIKYFRFSGALSPKLRKELFGNC